MNRHPGLQEALDSVPIEQRSAAHGRCAAVSVIDDALQDGADLDGAVFSAVGVSTCRHYDPCSSCSWIMRRFGMRSAPTENRAWVEPRPGSGDVARLISLVENVAYRRHAGDRRLRVAITLDLFRALEPTRREAADLDVAEARWFRGERIAEFEQARARVFAQNDLMITGLSPDVTTNLRNALMLFAFAEPDSLDGEAGSEVLGTADELGIPLATLKAVAEKHLGDIDAIARAETAGFLGRARLALRKVFS